MTPERFRECCPRLVHYSPRKPDLDLGLLTAAQVLDLCADSAGSVSARFAGETDFRAFPKNHWKETSRFLKGGDEVGSSLIVKHHKTGVEYQLGNNWPLKNGSCLGTTVALSDNRPGDPAPTKAQWFSTLNRMFWMFDAGSINAPFFEHVREAAGGGPMWRLEIRTIGLTDALLAKAMRVAGINGGGFRGRMPRGTATYVPLADWKRAWPPADIAFLDGIDAKTAEFLSDTGNLKIAQS